jgi:hypothetical protein
MAKADLNPDRLRELINYNPLTGEFIWQAQPTQSGKRGKYIKLGSVAGNTSLGYRRIRIDGELYLAHRLAWLYEHSTWPDGRLDHINGDKDDNRMENLRVTTNRQNSQNIRKPHADSASGFLGVTWSKHAKRWHAGIGFNDGRIGLGYFDTPEEAHAAYLEAKRKLHAGCTI